jgi:hypothetical protein
MEPDTVQQLNLEERAYYAWVRAEKNRILSMTDSQKKQAAWNKIVSPFVSSDDWMLSAKVF